MDLARALSSAAAVPSPFRVGIVTTAPAAGVIGVNVDGATTVLPVLAGTAYAVGDSVLVARSGHSGGVVVGRYGIPAAVDPPPAGSEPPAPGAELRTATLLPTFTGTWERTTETGRWLATSDVLQGPKAAGITHMGTVDYGAQLVGLGADLGQAHSASLTYLRLPGYGGAAAAAPRFFGLDDRGPDGPDTDIAVSDPQYGAAVAPGGIAQWQVPQGHVTKLLNGTFLGWMLNGPDYMGLAGAASDAAAFPHTMTYYG